MFKINALKVGFIIMVSSLSSSFAFGESQDDAFGKLETSGYMVIDMGVVSKELAGNDPSTDGYLRKLKVSFDSEFTQGWKADLTLEFDDGELKLDDYSIEYSGVKGLDLKVGKADLVLGLQNSTSSKVNATLEKDMASDALIPDGDFGGAVSWNQKQYSVFVNAFEANKDFDTSNNTFGASARLVYLLNKDFHFGVNASVLDYGGQNFQITQSAELKMSDDIVEGEMFRVSSMNFLSLEYAHRLKSINFQAEWMWLNITADQSFNAEQQNASHDGGYIQMSYFLNAKSNKFKKGSYAKRDNSEGLIELVSRYSQLNVQNQLDRIQDSSVLIGVNYYVSDGFRVMTNLVSVSGHGIGLIGRAQISF